MLKYKTTNSINLAYLYISIIRLVKSGISTWQAIFLLNTVTYECVPIIKEFIKKMKTEKYTQNVLPSRVPKEKNRHA